MNRRKPITARQLAREKLLFRYSSALERGDFDTLTAILREAEADPVLEKMLAEMDAVYRAELAPLPVLPTLSTNHNHRHTREDETMNVTYPTISRRLPDTRSGGRWNSTATLAAAMIALALFAAVLISRRPPTDPQQGSPGIAMQNETVTPVPSSTPTPGGAGTLQPYRYTLREGEDLFSVILRFGYKDTDMAQVLALNGLTSENWTALPAGTEILLPRIPGNPDFTGCETGEAFISSPANPGSASGLTPIYGMATTEDFAYYHLEISGPQTSGGFAIIVDSNQAVPQTGVIGELDSNQYQPGEYQLRLSVFDTTNTPQAACTVTIYINTATPTAVSQQMLPTFTATPMGGLMIPTIVPPNTMQTVLCTGTVYMPEGINLLSQPNINGIVIGRIPASTSVEVLIQQIEVDVATNQGWYFVQVQNPAQVALGWMPSSMVTETSACQSATNPCNVTPAVVAIEATPTWTPTPAPGLQVEPLDVTATPNLMPTFVPTVPPPCVNVPQLSITPTAGIPYGAWNSAMLRESVNGIPANTPVRIVGAFFDGQIWLYAIETLDDSMNAYAPESALIIYAPMDATPIATFDMALRDGGYVLLTTELVGDIPANALVRINSAQYNGSEWLYEVIAQDGQVRGEAHDWQLQFAPDFVPGAVTPTAMFDGALGSGFYAAVTNQAVGNIPAGIPVQIGSAFYNGVEWHYNITDASGRDNTARESQLDFAPGYTPGMATPTAAYFDLRGQVLITLVQVGPIPPNTPVQATSGYYDGNEWVYGVMTLDSTAFADARASQLRAVSLDEAGVQPTSIPPTFPPTLTPTPFS